MFRSTTEQLTNLCAQVCSMVYIVEQALVCGYNTKGALTLLDWREDIGKCQQIGGVVEY